MDDSLPLSFNISSSTPALGELEKDIYYFTWKKYANRELREFKGQIRNDLCLNHYNSSILLPIYTNASFTKAFGFVLTKLIKEGTTNIKLPP